MKKILIHIGYGKTASTLFQKYLFYNHKDINYLGGVRFENYNSQKSVHKNTYLLFRAILSQDSLNFNTKYWSKFYQDSIYTNLSEEKLNVFSEEWLTFTPLSLVDGDRGLVAQRLHDIFGDNIKILVFIRNQNQLLNSIYNKHLQTLLPLYSRSNSWSSEKKIDRLDYFKLLIQTEDYGILSKYKYYALINKYKSLFNDNLIVKLYEDFNKDHKSFLESLALDLNISYQSFLDCYPDHRIKVSKNKKENLKNIFAKILSKKKSSDNTKDIFSGNFIGIKNMPIAEAEKYIEDYFREDNYKLGKLLSKNLTEYGYHTK